MTIGIWILGDRLWDKQAALLSCARQQEQIPVILIESSNFVRQRPYHRQKVVLVWSAMRHFAEELRSQGWQVSYEIADDFQSPLRSWIEQNSITELRVTMPNDRPFIETIENLKLNCKINFIPDNHFLWSAEDFKKWASSRKRLLMEDFYREGRKKFNVLMAGKEPVGGKWNFDRENRKPPKDNFETPKALWFEPDEIVRSVIDKVKSEDIFSYGEVEPFRWGVTRQQALEVLNYFIEERLATFGPYQDAMVTGEETMWHGMLSAYMNIGLLHPMEIVDAVEKAYLEKNLELNSVEGFIRQILGWREYMHGIYHYLDADYFNKNWFEHTRPLPEFYWNASKANMNCLHQILSQVERTGYAHHIQRLMVLNNFALIAGVKPQEIESWFHAAFIDAYDWVMQTNVIGMGQFADGGMITSKPYVSSANYINRMSDYCKNCRYNPRDRHSEKACPFNFFYWDFLDRHRARLKSLGRMNIALANLERIPAEELNQIRSAARNWWEKNKGNGKQNARSC